jgi:hypothetical protein
LSDKRPSKVDAADGELANEFYGTFYLAKDKKKFRDDYKGSLPEAIKLTKKSK